MDFHPHDPHVPMLRNKEKSGLQIPCNVMKSVKFRPHPQPVRLIKYFTNNMDYVLTNYPIKYE